MTTRSAPNILVCGTPGTGKTTLCERLCRELPFTHYPVSHLAVEHKFTEGYDEAMDTHVIDEDAVLDHLEPLMANGGALVDYHAAALFPERWFDLVIVLTANNTVLFDRLRSRGYAPSKITANVECEIFQVLREEALESYNHDIVRVLPSDTMAALEQNVASIVAYTRDFCARAANASFCAQQASAAAAPSAAVQSAMASMFGAQNNAGP